MDVNTMLFIKNNGNQNQFYKTQKVKNKPLAIRQSQMEKDSNIQAQKIPFVKHPHKRQGLQETTIVAASGLQTYLPTTSVIVQRDPTDELQQEEAIKLD